MNFPEKCPYCGKDNSPNYISIIGKRINDDMGSYVEQHNCVHCQMPIFIIKETYRIRNAPAGSKIIQYYPCSNFSNYQPHVKKLSPDAFKIYEQTMQARAGGLDTLLGAGLRMTLEKLVSDYLAQIQGFDEKKLISLKLDKKIECMTLPNYTKVCSHLLRIYGNREIHVTPRDNISVEEALVAYHSLCDLIEAELIVKEANNRLGN